MGCSRQLAPVNGVNVYELVSEMDDFSCYNFPNIYQVGGLQ